MRRLFIPALSAVVLLIPLQVASLWAVVWTRSDRSTRVWVAQGCLRLWAGEPGDLPSDATGLLVGSWSGHVLDWAPTLELDAEHWVAAPGPSGTGRVARPIHGLYVQLPLAYAPAMPLAVAAAAFRPWRRHRRVRAGLCPRCAYELAGPGPHRCPECGTTSAGCSPPSAPSAGCARPDRRAADH